MNDQAFNDFVCQLAMLRLEDLSPRQLQMIEWQSRHLADRTKDELAARAGSTSTRPQGE